MTQHPAVVIVGAGLAGARCAETLRREGFGGGITVVGDEHVPPYERPALSKEFLAATRSAEQLFLRPSTFWEEHGIELVLGHRVVRVDAQQRTVTTDRGRELGWHRLVLATGARPRTLPLKTPPGVHVLRSLADAVALRTALARSRRLAVVGGGFVGAEVASTARTLGVEVTIVEATEGPFVRLLGPEVSSLLARLYRANGVDLRTNALAARFIGAGGRLRAIELSDGATVACDVALVAVGVEPVCELAESVPGVELAGDVAGGPGHWTNAAADGAAAARRLLALDPLPRPVPFFWSDQFGLRLQLAGDTRLAATVTIDGDESRFVARYCRADETLVAALAANSPADVTALRRQLASAA